MAVTAFVVDAIVKAAKTVVVKALSLIERAASFSCPSISGHSISAVAPDHNFEGGTALAAA